MEITQQTMDEARETLDDLLDETGCIIKVEEMFSGGRLFFGNGHSLDLGDGHLIGIKVRGPKLTFVYAFSRELLHDTPGEEGLGMARLAGYVIQEYGRQVTAQPWAALPEWEMA